ncbi:MAG: hypothetical protein RIC80_16475 [Cyclobacteriaceae bacterium]
MTFNFSDSWLLTSIRNAEESEYGATLKDVIAYADYSNHAIMNWEELRDGLLKLISLGLVIENNHKLVTTKKFKEWWYENFNSKKRIYVHKQIELVQTYMNKAFSSFETEGEKKSIKLTEDDYQNALREYLKMTD